MNNKRIILMLVCIFMLSSLVTHAETKKLREIGRYKFANVNDTMSQEDMKAALESKAADLKFGFETAGYSDLYAGLGVARDRACRHL